MKNQLFDYIKKYINLEVNEFELIWNSMQEKTFSKKAYLLKEGSVCTKKYFILNGLTRTYHIDNKGNEKITQFGLENWWVTNIESYKTERPSMNNIQALETTKTLCIDKLKLENLYQRLPKFERFFRLINENWLIAIQRRNEVYLKLSSKQRYEQFIQTFPDFAQRVPQYMIASYLEITPEYLSALRSSRYT